MNKRPRDVPLKQFRSEADELSALLRENEALQTQHAQRLAEHREMLADNVRANQTYLQEMKDSVNVRKENTALKQRYLEQMLRAEKAAASSVFVAPSADWRGEVERLEAEVQRQRIGMDEQFRQGLLAFFSNTQIDLLLGVHEEDVRWSSEELQRALRLFQLSPQAYQMVRTMLKFPLPREVLLKR